MFLIADADVRTSRRHLELAAKGIDAEWDEIQNNLLERDRIDSNQPIVHFDRQMMPL
ncbi:MAG: (d)CMP kinase [Saprospiraceae bacterium]